MGPQLFGLDVAVVAAFAFAQGTADRPAEAPKELLDRLEEIAKSAPPPQPRRGDHSIRGRVVTEEGAPLSGVLVRATSSEHPSAPYDRRAFEDEPPPDLTLARSFSNSARYWYSRHATTYETTSAADGTFAIDRLVDGRFLLQAWRKGFAIESRLGRREPRLTVPVDVTVDLVAIPTVEKRIDLQVADGSSPERATLLIEGVGDDGRSQYDTWRPDAPAIHLPVGDWYVTAMILGDRSHSLSPRDASFASPRTLVTAAAATSGESAASDIVRLRLEGVPAIEGEILTGLEAPRFSMRVAAVLLKPGEAPDPALFKNTRHLRNRGVLDAMVQSDSEWGWTYRVGPIDAGRWFIGLLEYGSDAPFMTAVVDVGEGVVRHDFALAPRDPEAEVRVHLLDPSGAPLHDGRFDRTTTILNPNGPPSKRSGGVNGSLRIDGAFSLDRKDLGTECVLFAEHPRFGRKAVRIPAEAGDLKIRFAAAASATLRLKDFAENVGGRHVEVEIADVTDAALDWGSRKLDDSAIAADGTVDVGNLQPGTWSVRVTADSDRYDGRAGFEVAFATFELAAGPQELTLPFPPLGTLRLAVAAAVKEGLSLAPIASSSTDERRSTRYASPDATGTITFSDLPPGLYEVRGSGDRFMVVEAPSSKVIAFVPEAVNAQRVVVIDPKGRLAVAGLKSGDLVVAIDGREFASRDELDRIRQSLRGDGVTLTVDRAGQLFEVVLPPALLKDERAAGGRFRDASR